MSTVVNSTVMWTLIGLVFGAAYTWVWIRLSTPRSDGLVDTVKARRRGERYMAASWAVIVCLQVWRFVEGGGSWRLVAAAVGVLFVVHFVRRVRKANAILNSPFLYLAALTYEFGKNKAA